MAMTHPFSQDFIEQAFLGEVLSQAEYALDAFRTAQASLGTTPVDPVYRGLHSLLVHAGNISKLLWPIPSKDKAKAAVMASRASALLGRLKLPSHIGPVLSSRELRNHLEHFDERLDAWAGSNPTSLVDRNIGPLAAFGVISPAMVLRHYDPTSRTFIFAGTTYDIGQLVAAVTQVRDAALAARPSI